MSISTVALAGNPNCGKTALFNALTHGRQKVGNYPGVTVEKKEGVAHTPEGLTLRILDLPGTYSLDAKTPDEEITREVLLSNQVGESAPDLILAVADATHLSRSLGLVLELKELGRPVVLALNMADLAAKRGAVLDIKGLSEELGIPIVPTVATTGDGVKTLLSEAQKLLEAAEAAPPSIISSGARLSWIKPSPDQIRERFCRVDSILYKVTKKALLPTLWTDRIDHILLHPVWGTLILMLILAATFQAIFSWANWPMDGIKAGIDYLSHTLEASLPDGALRSLLINGIIAGCGAILVFLPQILLLYFFLLILEDSGYMARGAFLMDRIMGKAGLNGRAFIPLLSSFACAIPGIMATRTIENRRDRIITILVAPLMTCSARLPVYSLLIAAFIPAEPMYLRGLVMFILYFSGIAAALLMAFLLKRTVLQGPKAALLIELPTYKWPSLRNVIVELWERAKIFTFKAGTVILALSIILWFLASYPKAPEKAEAPAISYSYVGNLGHLLEPVVRPIGFNWQIAVSLIPGFAAREIVIGALATVYAVESHAQSEEEGNSRLGAVLSKQWSMATGLSLLVWYIFSCQCFSTLAITRRETNSTRWPVIMFVYMTVLAYAASFITYQVAIRLGGG